MLVDKGIFPFESTIKVNAYILSCKGKKQLLFESYNCIVTVQISIGPVV